ncbi:MAG: helix-turn-helix domain-containing protein [Candidatus Omnitrophica bacterium]|jgi:excisionase family DNA binding protein|nr:helix-turn-helix domain-containing protein [Candidatus Omnitrophota bacterium]
MGEEKLLTIRDVALYLNVSEREVMDLAEQGKIPAYKIAGVYLRFRKEQVESYKNTLGPGNSSPTRDLYPFKDKVSDFLYYNDFYIFSTLIVLFLLLFIFR